MLYDNLNIKRSFLGRWGSCLSNYNIQLSLRSSSLSERLNEIDFFRYPEMDGSIFLFIMIARSSRFLIWLENKVLFWAEEVNELSYFSSISFDFVLCAHFACASHTIDTLLSSYFFIGQFRWTFVTLLEAEVEMSANYEILWYLAIFKLKPSHHNTIIMI